MLEITDALIEELRIFVKGSPTEAAFHKDNLEAASELLAKKIGGRTIPESVYRRAIIELAADLYHRRRARNGVAVFENDTAEAFRISRDPMRAVEDLLAPYLIQGFA